MHEPVTPSSATKGTSQAGPYGDWIHELDRSVGMLLKELDKRHLNDNTLVIFTSDNGFFWGEHGRGDKRLAYDESIRVPLLMRGPGVARNVQRSGDRLKTVPTEGVGVVESLTVLSRGLS